MKSLLCTSMFLAVMAVATVYGADPAENRNQLIQQVQESYRSRLKDLEKKLQMGKDGQVAVGIRNVFMPKRKGDPILFPTVDAKNKWTAEVEAEIQDLRDNPAKASGRLVPPLKPKQIGSIGEAKVAELMNGTALVQLPIANGTFLERPENYLRLSRRVRSIVDQSIIETMVWVEGVDSTFFRVNRVSEIPGLFQVVGSDGKYLKLSPVQPLTQSEIKQVRGD